MWGNMSTESRNKVKEHANFDEDERDPASLWAVAKAMHMSAATGNTAIDQPRARNTNAQLRQETLTIFKKRFDDAITVMKAVSVALPPQSDQAMDFFFKLDNGRYASLKVEVENQVLGGVGQLPQSLTEIHTLASRHKIVTSTGAQKMASQYTVFVANVPGRGTGRGGGGRGADGGGGGRHTDGRGGADRVGDDKGKARVKLPCKLGDGTDHWVANCPKLEEARKAVDKQKKVVSGDTAHVTYKDDEDPDEYEDPDEDEYDVGRCDCGLVLMSGLVDRVFAGGIDRFGVYDLLLDSEASCHLIRNPKLLTNI
jgi:hypothetical protein